MFRVAISLLSCLALLACPLACMGHVQALFAQSEAPVAQCCCCHPPVEHSSPSPDNPREDDPCSNCLCLHGAPVEDVGASFDVLDALPVAWLIPNQLLFGGSFEIAHHRMNCVTDESPPFSGRTLRVSLRSLQI